MDSYNPRNRSYAVYVSYQTLPNSVSDAKYLVFHKGGVTEFKVNQRIGGGTWVYLGTFEFDKGSNDYGMVVLSNESSENGVICADAVRFGGGMGNISRYIVQADYPVIWREPVILPNGQVCPMMSTEANKEQMTMLTTSMHAPTPSITCPVVLYSIPDKKDWCPL